MWWLARSICKACQRWTRKRSGSGADRMGDFLPPWGWRAIPIFSRPEWISHGVHDWSVFLPHWENQPGAPDAKEAEKLAFDSSPDAAVSTWKSPVLLIHGDDDRNVPFGQTVDLAQRLREQHVKFEELIFPDEIHDFLMWKNWIRAYGATADFFDRTLKTAGQGSEAWAR